MSARLAQAWHGDEPCERWVSARWAGAEAGEVRGFAPPLGPLLGRLFGECAGLVLFMPVGAAVRLVAPLLRDKRQDPAVVVVDDAGRFAVSLLTGHRVPARGCGANRLAERVAAVLGAIPVVTTGSDVLGVPCAETLGAEHGWRIEAARADLVRLSAAFVNGEPVGWYQNAGEMVPEVEAPTCRRGGLPEADPVSDGCAAGVVVSDLVLPALLPGWVVYRPGTLALGIGCSRGASADEIEGLARAALAEAGLALGSVRAIGTVELKRDETGLTEAATRLGLPVRYYSTEELASVAEVPTPSEVVRRHLGVTGVAEPAAILAARGGTLVLPKRKSALATVAVARRAEGGL